MKLVKYISERMALIKAATPSHELGKSYESLGFSTKVKRLRKSVWAIGSFDGYPHMLYSPRNRGETAPNRSPNRDLTKKRVKEIQKKSRRIKKSKRARNRRSLASFSPASPKQFSQGH